MPEQFPYLPSSQLEQPSLEAEHSLSRQASEQLAFLLQHPEILNQINQNSVVVRHM